MKTYELGITLTIDSDRMEYEVSEEILYYLKRLGHYTPCTVSIDHITDITEETND